MPRLRAAQTTAAASDKISISDLPGATTIAVTRGLPSVSVPVLSTTSVSMRSVIAAAASKNTGTLPSMPRNPAGKIPDASVTKRLYA